jgi:siroheme synthase-like protein
MTFPAALDLRGKRCLVVGSGGEALRRVTQFQEVGAKVRWVTRGMSQTLEGVEVLSRGFEASDVDDAWIVILADQDAALAAELGKLCAERRTFFCAIDQPTHNSFSHMARIDAPPVIIAISTGGQVPGLAGKLRELLAVLFVPAVVRYFSGLTQLRAAESDPTLRKSKVKAALAALELSGEFKLPPHDGT